MVKTLVSFFVAVCLGVAGFYLTPAAARENAGTGASVAQAVPVRAVAVARRDMPVILRAVGTVVPMQSVAVKSRIDSQIMAVKFHDGDNVKKGDTLFVLDDRVLKAQMQQAEANMQRDKAQYENAKLQYDRTLKLAKQGYATGSTRDDARAAMDAQEATIAADKAAMDNIRVQLGYTVITAPIDGRTGTINVTIGNTVKANDSQALVTINQIQPVQVQASLPQASFVAVREALQAGTVEATARREGGNAAGVTGQVQYIDNVIDQSTGTFVTRSVFANADEGLWPGMLVDLAITLREDKGVAVVPEVAIQHAPSGDYVYTVDNGKAVRRDVTVARMQDGMAIIAKGLDDADRVVTDGQMALRNGSAVSVVQ